MVLCKYDIEQALESGSLKIDPAPDRDSIQQVSVDLRLGRRFTTFKKLGAHIPAIYVDASVFDQEDMWHIVEQDAYRLEPRKIVLAQTLESVTLPNHLMGMVEGRSSWGRFGVTIHVTAPKIDPGWSGPIVLEMANLSENTYELRAGVDKPAQLILFPISQPLKDTDAFGPGHRFYQQVDATGRRAPSSGGGE